MWTAECRMQSAENPMANFFVKHPRSLRICSQNSEVRKFIFVEKLRFAARDSFLRCFPCQVCVRQCVSECEHPRAKWKYRFYKYERSMEPRPQVLMARRSPPFPRYAMLFRAGRNPTTLPRRMPKLSTLNLGRGGPNWKT